MREKLTSTAGASLVIALFLFLICTVLGTVVLSAASASVGRMAVGSAAGQSGTLTELDQRYYSVTSAARLLGEALSGAKVELSQEALGDETGPESALSNYEDEKIVISPVDVPCGAFLKDLALVWSGWRKESVEIGNKFSLSLGEGYAALDVDGTYTMSPSGILEITIENGAYQQNLTFTPTVSKWVESRMVEIGEDPITGEIQYEWYWTRHASIEWELSGIRGRDNVSTGTGGV